MTKALNERAVRRHRDRLLDRYDPELVETTEEVSDERFAALRPRPRAATSARPTRS